jgi:hypothetical protein
VTRPRHRNVVAASLSVVVALLAVLVIGGYGFGWRWTGLSAQVTLWDWLEALALPVAIGSVPVLLRHRQRLTARHRSILLTALVVFGLFVMIGYLVPLGWTGFTGNTLWDWLELLVLPVAVAAASWAHGAPSRDPRLLRAAAAGLATFAVLVACGYMVPWRWTGFSGNTMWDWVKMLLVPLLIPTILVPAVAGRIDERLARPRASRRHGGE